jgi:uncharacterized protein (TIGR00290 family)
MTQVFASWSGGKDSCFACHRAILEGLRVSHLLNMITEDGKRSCSHGLSAELIAAQSEAIGIPILQRKTAMGTYEQEFKGAIHQVRSVGVEGGIFGDIDFEEHREWVDRVCQETGVQAFLPLWGCDQMQILKEFITSGFEAIIVAVKAELCGEEWVGRGLDSAFITQVSDLKQRFNISICGEAGEYHTLVVDGPLFKKRIEILESSKMQRNGYYFLDISKYELKAKCLK